MIYRGVNIRLLKQPSLEAVRALYARLLAEGCNAVALTFSYYVSMRPGTPVAAWPPVEWRPDTFIYPDVAQDPAHPFGNTPTVEHVYECCKLAREMGFQSILLKPHIDSYDAHWRGAISVQGIERAFSVSYRKDFLGPLLPIVRELDIDLCIGTELVQITRELGARFWINLARWVREQGVTQPITYAANWGWEMSAEWNLLTAFWPHAAYIGANTYQPHADVWDDRQPIRLDMLLSGIGNIGWHHRLADPVSGEPHHWCPTVKDDLIRLSKQVDRPIRLTEIGFPNNERALLDPPGDKLGGQPGTYLSGPLWEASRIEWDNVPECDGWYAWEAALEVPEGEVRTHDILGSGLEGVVWGGGTLEQKEG